MYTENDSSPPTCDRGLGRIVDTTCSDCDGETVIKQAQSTHQ